MLSLPATCVIDSRTSVSTDPHGETHTLHIVSLPTICRPPRTHAVSSISYKQWRPPTDSSDFLFPHLVPTFFLCPHLPTVPALPFCCHHRCHLSFLLSFFLTYFLSLVRLFVRSCSRSFILSFLLSFVRSFFLHTHYPSFSLSLSHVDTLCNVPLSQPLRASSASHRRDRSINSSERSSRNIRRKQ